jgi:hypothetical protein
VSLVLIQGRVPKDVAEAIQKQAESEQRSVSNVVRLALAEYVQKREKAAA